jgi:hypothetical protein
MYCCALILISLSVPLMSVRGSRHERPPSVAEEVLQPHKEGDISFNPVAP